MRFVLARLLRLVPLLFVVSLATFLMLELVPGDPAIAVLGPDASAEQRAMVRDQLGLDRPVAERYLHWLGGAVRGDLGTSLRPPTQEVASMIASRLPVTLEITLLAMGIALVLAVPAAIAAAYRPRRGFDRLSSGVSFGFISAPSFLAALILIFALVFHQDGTRVAIVAAGVAGAVAIGVGAAGRARRCRRSGETAGSALGAVVAAAGVLAGAGLLALVLPDLPRQGFVRWTDPKGKWENLRHAFLPALTLALTEAAVFFRLLRNDMIVTLQEDFILAARAKGMPTWRILLRDALRPSSFSLITVAGVSMGRLLGGTAIVETIFNLPGMGTLVVNSIGAKDFTVIQGAVLVLAVCYVLLNALVDVSYVYLDPRVRRGRA